jgi:hypothetical protein
VRALLLAIALGAGAAGCQVTGYAGQSLEFRGTVTADDGSPLPGTRVRILLPAGWWMGVGPLEQDPSTYGHEDLRLTAEADADGRYVAGPASGSYRSRIWILPPFLTLFDRAPDPGMVVRLEDEGEYYVVRALPDRLEVETYDRADGRLLLGETRYRLGGNVVPCRFVDPEGRVVIGRRVVLHLRRNP